MKQSIIRNKGTIEIKTDKLLLRKFKIKDYKNMHKNYLLKESSYAYISGKPINIFSAFFVCLYNVLRNTKKNNYCWAIVFNNQVVGTISVNYIENHTRNCSIGYIIGEQFCNKGIATEAVKAVIKYLLHEVKLHKISARHYSANLASGKVMQKAGMQIEAVFKDEYFKNSQYYDSIMYSIFE